LRYILVMLFRFAHEVYVLSPGQITHDKTGAQPNVWHVLTTGHNLRTLILFSILTAASLCLALWLKSKQPFQKIGRLIDKATPIAPDVIRIAFGLSLIVSATKHSLFGPELPLDSFPPAGLIRPGLLILGVALTLGVFTRYFGLLAIGLWLFALASKGWYILTYANYLGEAIAVVLLPVQTISLDHLITRIRRVKLKRPRYNKYSMPAARLLFGFSLLYAAINVKFVTPALSLDVVNHYHLTHYFPFDPLFVVLGAGLVECMIAVLYMLGLLQRLNTILFLSFLTLSLLYFKESVWPHYLLIALGLGIFLHKPDVLALDGRLFKKTRR